MIGSRISTSGHSSSTVLPPLAPLSIRIEQSSDVWRSDLRALFEQAKDRFGDVVWNVGSSVQDRRPLANGNLEEGDEDELKTRPSTELLETDTQEVMETVWGHKAMIYARAPPAFQYRYFPRTINRSSTPSYRSPSAAFLFTPKSEPNLDQTTSSLRVPSRSSLYSAASTYRPSPTQIRVGVTPQMFKAELEWLYTGEGMGDVAEWLNQDTSTHAPSGIDGNPETPKGLFGLGLNLTIEEGAVGVGNILKIEGRKDEKREILRNDLVYMWRSKLYSDIKIVLPCESVPESSRSSTKNRHSLVDSNLSDDSSSSTCAVFSTHKFILASRSPYFASLLLNSSGFRSGDWEDTNEIELFSPPFTPASIHFCLGYMYAGTLTFSNRTYDLTTAFEIYRSATYLLMDSLCAEMESRIIHEMCDGLNLSSTSNPSNLCSRRVPRVWRFAGASDVGAQDLRSRTRAWVVRHWADCWGKEIGEVEAHERDALVNEVIEGLNPSNVCTYLRGVNNVRSRTESELRTTTGLPRGFKQNTWLENLLDMVSKIEYRAKGIWITQFGDVVRSIEFAELLGGKGFGMDLLEGLMSDVINSAADGKQCKHAGKIYQDLVKSMLSQVKLDKNELLLRPGSAMRILVENTRTKVLGHLKRRWLQVREHSGFIDLEPWALKEISDGIGQPVEELVAPPLSPFVPPTRAPPILSSSVSRSARNAKEPVPSKSISRSSSTRRLNEDPKLARTTDTNSQSNRSTTSSRAVTAPRLATVPARLTTTSSVVPKPGLSTITRPTSDKSPIPKSISSLSLSGRRSVGGAGPSARSSAAEKPTSSSTSHNLPATASRTSTTSSLAPSSTRTRFTSSSKSTPASTPSSSVIASSSTTTPSLLTTSPSTKSVDGIPDVNHKLRLSASAATLTLPSSNLSMQSNSTSKPKVSNMRQSPSVTTISRLSSPTPTNSVSKLAPKTNPNTTLKTSVVGSRNRLSSTTSNLSVRSSTEPFRASNVSTSSKTVTSAVIPAGSRTRTTTSPSIKPLTQASSVTPTGARVPRQRTHTSPDLPVKAASVATPSASTKNPPRSLGRTSSASPLVPTKQTPSSLRSSNTPRDPIQQDTLNKKPVISAKTISRSNSSLSNKGRSVEKLVSVASSENTTNSSSFDLIKTSDSASPPQSKPEIRSPLKPKLTQSFDSTTPSISPGSTGSTQSPPALSVSSLLSPAFVKRARAHPASSFDPPRRLPQPRPTLTLDKFSIHSLSTGEPIEPSPGISLHVGIPCIVSIRAIGVSSGNRGKKVRCKAWARYIGGIVGRDGAWVGVELAEDIDGAHQQEDEEVGCWKGVRYYKSDNLELGDEWESSEGGTTKKRRSLMNSTAKDEKQRRRGMFLAPEDVVWVKGA